MSELTNPTADPTQTAIETVRRALRNALAVRAEVALDTLTVALREAQQEKAVLLAVTIPRLQEENERLTERLAEYGEMQA